jgi:hypothetical protein
MRKWCKGITFQQASSKDLGSNEPVNEEESQVKKKMFPITEEKCFYFIIGYELIALSRNVHPELI